MNTAVGRRLSKALASRQTRGQLRQLDPSGSPEHLIDFSSNDYLSLSRSPELKRRLLAKLQESRPFGPPSSRLLDGNSVEHLALENKLASFFRADSALLFNSGFDANVGLWSCIAAEDDVIIYDSLVHASTHDGMRASKCRRTLPFAHNDPASLARVIEGVLAGSEAIRRGEKSVFVAVEALYSMDGDLAPLTELLDVLDRLLPHGNGHLVVDEAHSTGLYGPDGRGCVCALGVAHRCFVRIATFGKSMACGGGAILASPLVRSCACPDRRSDAKDLINYARPLIYSTVMSRMNVAAISASLEMLEGGHTNEAAAHVHDLASYLLRSLRRSLPADQTRARLAPPLERLADELPSIPANSIPRTSSIVPILSSEPLALSQFLAVNGFLARAVRFPTVPLGQERVRICLHAANTRDQVRRAMDGLISQVDGLVAALREFVQPVIYESATEARLQARL